MKRQGEFERLTEWIDRLNTSMDAARVDQETTGNMVASAEYELTLMRRSLASLHGREKATVPARGAASNADGSGGAGDAFNMKLRHPESTKRARHWLALGSLD